MPQKSVKVPLLCRGEGICMPYDPSFIAYFGEFSKNGSGNEGANENLSCAFLSNSGNRSGSCSENCGFRIAQVVRCHSENGISHSENHFLNSQSCSKNTSEFSESSENGLFTPRAFFLKLGWSLGFLSNAIGGRTVGS